MKKLNLKQITFLFLWGFISFSLTRVGIGEVKSVFLIPFIFFSFFIDFKYGVISYIVSFLFFIFLNVRYLFLFLMLFMVLVCVKKIYVSSKIKFEFFLSIISLLFTLLECFLVENLIIESVVFLSFFSYWMMRYFYKLYIVILNEKKDEISFETSVFFLSVLGLVFYGMNINIYGVNLSFVLLLLLAFIGGRLSFSLGIIYSFLLGLYLISEGYLFTDLLIIFVAAILSFFMKSVSKVTLLFCYIFIVSFFVYYFKINYIQVCEYIGAGIIYLFISNKVMNRIENRCVFSSKYKEIKMHGKNKEKKEISNKLLKISYVLSLFCEKLDDVRVRKNEKELLHEELLSVENYLKKISGDVLKEDGVDYFSKEIYKYNLDLISVYRYTDILNSEKIRVVIRCSKRDLYNIVLGLVNRCFNSEFNLGETKFNYIYGVYEVEFIKKIMFSLNYCVAQAAKESVSGDGYLVFENLNKRYFAISDGMGSGELARRKSKRLLGLFKDLIEVGFDEVKAIKSINYILRREDDKENYATLDLFVYNFNNGKFYFIKNGACDSYVFRDNEMSVVEGNNLPIGIVDKIIVNKKEVKLCEGDLIVVATDGVCEESIAKIISGKHKDVNKIAREIIGRDKEIFDDKSVIVLNIKK